MTFEEKLRHARQQAGLSQEQLAQKLYVTRAAIAKWESGKGMPDIQNLKALAKLLNVSVDYLLDEEAAVSDILRETICVTDHPANGRCRDHYEAAVVAKFPDAYWIVPAVLQFNLNKAERIINAITFGLFACIWQLCHWKEYTQGHYYLVETGDCQLLVQVEDTAITSTPLTFRLHHVAAFDVGNKRFIRSEYNLLEDSDNES